MHPERRARLLLMTTVGAIAVVLACDAQATSGEQLALGAAVTLLFLWQLSGASREDREIAIACVLVSTAIELFSTRIWGLYTYRLENLPLYVPPGHGVICLAALAGARAPSLLHRKAQVIGWTAATSITWSALSLWLANDVEGALFLVLFLPLLLGTNRGIEYALTYAVASFIEIAGTFFDTWEWAAVQPWIGAPSANPPSAAAGGYCTFLLASFGLVSLWRRASERVSSATTAPTPSA